MPTLEARPFVAEHLAAAGELLAERHRRHRSAEPLLPRTYEDPVAARGAVEAAWGKKGACGAVALRGGRLIGYVIGAPEDEQHWGPNDWIELAGHAVLEPEVVRDLYAAVAERSVEGGRHRHYVLVPASDGELLEAWYRVGFGQQQAYGIREVPAEAWPDGVREATAGDVDALLALAPLISQHHAVSPVFSDSAARRAAKPQAARDAERAELETDIASDEIGTTMVTDWRVTNLLASRFWPRRGFRTSFLRLYRSIR